MKHTLLIVLLCLVHPYSWAQMRKMPFLDLAEQMTPDTNAAKGLMTKAVEVELIPGRAGKADTSHIFRMTFNPSGLMKESEYFDYSNDPDQRNIRYSDSDPIFGKVARTLNSKLAKGSRVIYQYDDHQNLIARKGYKVLPKNSGEAFEKCIAEQMRKENREAQGKGKDDIRALDRMRQYLDALYRDGVPEVISQDRETHYTYDEDDNMISGKEIFFSDDRTYSYRHYADGRVQVRREVYPESRTLSNIKIRELHLTYTATGQVAGLVEYMADGDTANVVADKNIVKRLQTTYNRSGMPERITETDFGQERLALISYKGGQTASHIKLALNTSSGKYDTTSYFTYAYKKGCMAETRRRYVGGKVYITEREEVYRDAAGLQTEIKDYVQEPGRQEKLKARKLYFYSK